MYSTLSTLSLFYLSSYTNNHIGASWQGRLLDDRDGRLGVNAAVRSAIGRDEDETVESKGLTPVCQEELHVRLRR